MAVHENRSKCIIIIIIINVVPLQLWQLSIHF